MRVLIIAAHPDDEVLGMGGTIKKYVKQKHDVKIIILATGILARRSTKYINSTNYNMKQKDSPKIKKQISSLRNNAKKASSILGVKKIEFYDFPDNEMDTISNLEITKTIETEINGFNPDLVYTHSYNDINVDHRIIHNATITATRPKKNSRIKKVISFEVPSSTEWNFPLVFSPNIFVDISKELPSKIKALKFYKNEIMKFPHPRSIEGVKIIAKRWGTVSGFESAEAFSLVRELKNSV